MPAIKSRTWCFTLNNYTTAEMVHLGGMDADKVRYCIFGEEIGENGTPHLQGYIVFPNAVRMETVKQHVGARCHLEIAKGNVKQNYDYCSKDGKFHEFGDRPQFPKEKGEREKERYKRAWHLAKAGDLDALVDEHPDIAMRHYPTIKKIRMDALHNRCRHCGGRGLLWEGVATPPSEGVDGHLHVQRGVQEWKHWDHSAEEGYCDEQLSPEGYLGGPEGLGADYGSFYSDALPFSWEDDCGEPPSTPPHQTRGGVGGHPERYFRCDRSYGVSDLFL